VRGEERRGEERRGRNELAIFLPDPKHCLISTRYLYF
jgi:hypothetical protein